MLNGILSLDFNILVTKRDNTHIIDDFLLGPLSLSYILEDQYKTSAPNKLQEQ